MTQKQFYDWQTMGGSKDVSALVQSLEDREISWCMFGGLAVNHWAEEPMATADVDLFIVTKQLEAAVEAFQSLGFSREEFTHSVNLKGQSKVSIQITTAEFYQEFPSRSVPADVHGMLMRVASVEDTLAQKIAAFTDSSRRPSKRQKDIADISRLLELHPHLQQLIPAEVLSKLIF
ncbi:MAG: hypothetical protein B9S37_08390 [Verrucomicrobiia bacterium Tous-C3TDCM]|nr:MAG: hypothetical protein B9S37_08390 [Verrucomicrobiae bacterium Tous-C3TDCM]PAZ04833.1 MAG: hypothetical protein CAK88_10360 [Verrucomicrobiae bacterium AMD-G2]